MVPCARCGAPLAGTEKTCSFCGAATAFGAEIAAREEAARIALEVEAQRARDAVANDARKAAEAAVQRLGRLAMIWGLLSLVLGCFVVPNVVAIVVAVRAKRLAKTQGFVAPGGSTVGLVLGSVTLALFGLALGIGIHQDQQRARRAAELEAVFAQGAAAERLEQPTACALAEHALVTRGVDGSKPSYEAYVCDGALERGDGRAVLHDVQYRTNSEVVTLEATLKRGHRWMVESLRKTAPHTAVSASAEAPAKAPEASALPTTSAVPSPRAVPTASAPRSAKKR